MTALTVKALARATRVSTDAVRYYTRIGLLAPSRNAANGYRHFKHVDVVRVKFIKRAKTLGYRLEEIRELIAASERGTSPCPLAREIIERRITENRRALDEAQALQERMERAMRQWSRLPDGVPVGDSICYLIEQAAGEP